MKFLSNNKPPLVFLLLYIPSVFLLFFWPVTPAVALVQGYILSEEATLALRVCSYCGPESRIVDILYFSIAAVGLWWALLGAICQIRTNVAKLVFWPFSEIFARKAVKILMTVGIIIGIVFTGAIILSISPFFQP